MHLRIAAAALVAVSAPSVAQLAPAAQSVITPAVTPIAAPPTGAAVLRTGTEVPLKLSEMLTTKGKVLKGGQRVHLEVAENVLVNGAVVIPAGSPAIGEITEVRNKGMWGKSGHFAGRVLYTTVNGRQLRLTGVFDDKGVAGGTGAVAASALVFLPAGFFMTGTSAKLEMGTPVKAFMDEDVQLAMPAAAATPLVVGAPAVSPPLAAPMMVSATGGATKPVTQPAVVSTIAPAAKK